MVGITRSKAIFCLPKTFTGWVMSFFSIQLSSCCLTAKPVIPTSRNIPWPLAATSPGAKRYATVTELNWQRAVEPLRISRLTSEIMNVAVELTWTSFFEAKFRSATCAALVTCWTLKTNWTPCILYVSCMYSKMSYAWPLCIVIPRFLCRASCGNTYCVTT